MTFHQQVIATICFTEAVLPPPVVPRVQVREDPVKVGFLKDRKGPVVVSHSTESSIRFGTGVLMPIRCITAHTDVTGIPICC